jgi:ketosteroid isomerase-like protein
MNRRCTAFLIASVLSLAVLLGLAWAANVEEELKKLESDRAAAVVKGDLATLEKGTSDDYTLINVNGQMSDKSQMVNSIKSGDIKLVTDDLSDLKVRLYGNTAVVTGKANVKGTIGGKDTNGQIMFTRVWVKKSGTWQSVAFQQTAVANP